MPESSRGDDRVREGKAGVGWKEERQREREEV